MENTLNSQQLELIIKQALQDEGCNNVDPAQMIRFFKERQGKWFYIGALSKTFNLSAAQAYCFVLRLEKQKLAKIQYAIQCPQCGCCVRTVNIFNEIPQWAKCDNCCIGFTALENTYMVMTYLKDVELQLG